MSEKTKNIFSALRQRITARRVLLTVLAAFAVLLPTIIAVICIAGSGNSAKAPTRRINTVILYDDGGSELYRENFNARESGNTSLVSIFNTINNNLIQSEKISENVAVEAPITAKLIGAFEEKTLTCYFSFTQGASYCIDGNGTYFKIPAEDSERFLSSEFAEILYKDAISPLLSTADGDTVIPQSIDWHYRNIDGIFLSSSKNAVTEEEINYHVTGGVSLSFDVKPDICDVKITDDGNVIFSGSIEELSALKLSSSTVITVNITAEWQKTDGKRFYGALAYTFDITVHNRAEFSLSKTELSAGEYAVLKATYINDISKLYIKCDGFELTPNVMLNGETAYAVIPCPASLDAGCDFKLTVSYGIATQSFMLSVTDDEAKKQHMLNLAAASDGLTGQPNDSVTEYILGLSGVTSPTEYGYLQSEGFGTEIDGDMRYYTCYTQRNGFGTNVRAVSSGKIVRVEESATLGKCVTVDSGTGILFYYTHLSESDVSVGKYVALGDCIGKSGILPSGASVGFAIAAVCNGYVLNFELLAG